MRISARILPFFVFLILSFRNLLAASSVDIEHAVPFSSDRSDDMRWWSYPLHSLDVFKSWAGGNENSRPQMVVAILNVATRESLVVMMNGRQFLLMRSHENPEFFSVEEIHDWSVFVRRLPPFARVFAWSEVAGSNQQSISLDLFRVVGDSLKAWSSTPDKAGFSISGFDLEQRFKDAVATGDVWTVWTRGIPDFAERSDTKIPMPKRSYILSNMLHTTVPLFGVFSGVAIAAYRLHFENASGHSLPYGYISGVIGGVAWYIGRLMYHNRKNEYSNPQEKRSVVVAGLESAIVSAGATLCPTLIAALAH